jgi:hypothetical protein
MNSVHNPSQRGAPTVPAAIQGTAINKIMVVGHPLSGYEGVESLLNRCGMQAASPTQREGLSAPQIGATLLKAHRIIQLDPFQAHGPISPVQPGPIWQSLALDLLLSNIDQDLWGWSDPQAIYLLDYWKNLDPQLAFMLVYDTPQDLIARAFGNPAVPCTPDALQTAVNNWLAYNEAMLHFYHCNPQRCMLVHASQVRERANDYLQQVQLRIGAPLSLDTPLHPHSEGRVVQAQLASPEAATHHALRRYLAEHILSQQTPALALYEELQAAATLPHVLQAVNGANAHDAQADAHETHQALQAFQALQALESRQNRLQQTLTEQVNQNGAAAQKLALIQQDLETTRAGAQTLKAALETASAATKETAAQLTAERQQNEKLNQQVASQSAQLKQSASAPQPNPELEQENELLLTQLHQVQEELERYYLENQRLKAQPPKPPVPEKPAAPYGAANRIKEQLTYKLGAKMIERSRSLGGWLGMPFALVSTARQHQREKPLRQATKRIAIEKYRDAHEAERIKQHLSYRLGAVLIKHGKNPLRWPVLPFALNSARRAWKQQKASH